MFTPGRTPGQLDRRALGQRMLSQLIPQLQSFRFQGGQPGGDNLRIPTAGLRPGGPPLQRGPALPGVGANVGSGLSAGLGAPAPSGQAMAMGAGPSMPGLSAAFQAPRPAAAAPRSAAPVAARPAAPAPRPQAPAGPNPQDYINRLPASAPEKNFVGSDMNAFLRFLAAISGKGGGDFSAASAGGATTGGLGSQAGGGGGGMGSFS